MIEDIEALESIAQNRSNPATLSKLLPIVQSSFIFSKYEQILLTQLRDETTTTAQFRVIAQHIATILVAKVIECLQTTPLTIQTPVSSCQGQSLISPVEIVSIMRSGDALLDVFMHHFAESNISKVLIQRNPTTLEIQLYYMKISSTLSVGNPVIIVEPMIASGESLDKAISILKVQGVKEEQIVVASICAAPEGLLLLNKTHPKIQVVITAFDERLNDKKYIVPGLGDFGDRFFGTQKS